MYVSGNTEARSCNHSCNGKALIITYSESVFVARSIEHAIRKRHIVMCVLPRCTIIFPHYLTKGTFSEKKVMEQKNCVLIPLLV